MSIQPIPLFQSFVINCALIKHGFLTGSLGGARAYMMVKVSEEVSIHGMGGPVVNVLLLLVN